MPDPVISMNISGMDKIEKRLKELPELWGDMGVEAADNYLLGVLVNREIPPYKKVTRKEAYGKTFQSARQRRGFFYRLHHGLIDVPYIRRGKGGGIEGGWEIEGKGRKAILINNDPAVEWVYTENQARLLQLIGWLRVSQVIDKYSKNIVQSFERGVKAAIKKAGLQSE